MDSETPSDSETLTETVEQGNVDADETPDQATEPVEEQSKPDPGKQALLADLHKERKERQANQAKVEELTNRLGELQTKAETVDAVQTRYDRLEAFLQAAGGPLSRMLDSRSFTTALFESGTPVEEIVAEWNRTNPSATATALGSSGAAPANKGPDMNELLRAAIKQ